jgi:hypothetical protein
MAVSSKINIFPSNEPIGTVTNRWNRTNALAMPKAFIDDMIAYNNEYCSNNTQPIITANYPNCYFLQNAGNTRSAIGFDGTNWVLFHQYGAMSQRSLAGASIIDNIQNFGNETRGVTLQLSVFQYYSSNFSNGKTVILNQYNRRAYYYTENHTSYTLVKAPILSNDYVELTTPFNSNTTYSFFNVTQTKRIYTTDHITFSDCVGFGTANLAIHRMNNGHLYTTNSGTLSISTNNGINWTSYTLPASTVSSNNHCLDFDGTTYVYCAGTNGLWSSTNLSTWTARTSNITGTEPNHRVYFVNALFFVFSSTTVTTSFSTSTDGITWTNRTSPNTIICNSVRYVNSLYMILGTNRVITSSDGVTWASSIAFGNSDADADNRSFYATSTKALFVSSSGIAYFYNPSSWTTVTTSQLTTGLLNLGIGISATSANIKVR